MSPGRGRFQAPGVAGRLRPVRRFDPIRALDPDRLTLRRDLIEQLFGRRIDLPADVPLVLLPVRVEVRSTADGGALRVRIFPDAVHVESLVEGLDAAEVAAGQTYWRAVWQGAEPGEEAVWRGLIAAVGRRRAAWVAESLRPGNLAERPAGEPDFPTVAERVDGPSVVRTLPDRFLVRIEQDGAAPVTTAGRVIPEEIPVGLIDVEALTPLQLDDQDLPPLDESLRWLLDYDRAVDLGLAVTVPLPVPGQDVARVVVYGVRASLDPAAGAEALQHLLREHRYGDGAEFLAQGTPTNNTDSARADWSRRTPPGPPQLEPTPAPEAQSNAGVLAAALGLDPASLAGLPRALDGEQRRAAAFAEALWETTWADALEVITEPGRNDPKNRLDLPVLDAVHDHWVSSVRGRGPIPALRLGRQPYGLLPVLLTAAGEYRPLREDRLETQIVPYLQRLRPFWRDAAASVPTIMQGPLDEKIKNILGTDAVLRGLRVRTELSTEMMSLIGLQDVQLQDKLTAGAAANGLGKLLAGIPHTQLDGADRLTGKATRSLALPLVDASDVAFIENLLQAQPAPARPVSVLQVLLAHADAVSRHGIERVADRELRENGLRVAVSEAAADLDRDLVLRALEAMQAEAFDDDSLVAATEHLDRAVGGRLDRAALADANPYPVIAAPTLAQQVAGEQPTLERLRQPAGLRLVSELFRAGRRRGAFTTALGVIAGITDLDERRLLLAETLDCCSHRLDAWLTSVATRRLADLRAATPTGARLGAYAVLHRIRLTTATAEPPVDGREVLHDPGDGGYIHAPGLLHAATAGVLRSGRLSHRRGAPDSEALDIDLSSDRMRDALGLLEGIRNGQSLGALLGYRLERRLHDRSGAGLELDRFIYLLRTLAPLRLGKLTEPGTPAEESLAASDVVDGLVLREIPEGTIRARLQDGPRDQRYLGDGWVPPTPGEADAVLEEIARLEQTHDAVADLLLAESVHQLVSGNPARAAAALDLLDAGEAAPPDPEIVLQPRAGVALGHRLGVLICSDAAGTAGWSASPRSRAEPALELWAQQVLGPAPGLLAGVSALDVVFDADTDAVATSTLAARVRAALGDPAADVAGLEPVWEVAGLLRGLITSARRLSPADTGQRPDPDPAAEAGSAIGRRVLDAAELIGRADASIVSLKAAVAEENPSELLAFGVRPAQPSGPPLSAEEQAFAAQALLVEAQRRAEEATRLLAQASARLAMAQAEGGGVGPAVELAGQSLATVFGAGFTVLPRLVPGPADVLTEIAAAGAVPAGNAQLRAWLTRAGAIRPAAAAVGELLLVREAATGAGIRLRVLQSPPGEFASWIGAPFPDERPPQRPVESLVGEIVGADLAGPVAGLVFDEWTEAVPRRLPRPDPAQPEGPETLHDVVTTGVAVHANGPGARPPQAILLAMTPDGAPWTADRLVAVIDEALDLATLRGVTLPMIPYAGLFLPALYFRDWSLQGEPVIQWAGLAKETFSARYAVTHLSVEQP